MVARPFVVIEVVAEDLAIQQWLDVYAHLEESREVLVEQERRGEVVLVLYYVPDDALGRFHLVILKCAVDGAAIEELVRFGRALLDFVLVKDRVLIAEFVAKLV